MRRFLVVVGTILVLAGLRLYDNGLLGSGYVGEYTEYKKGGEVAVFGENAPRFADITAYASRLDIRGDVAVAYEALNNLNAGVKWVEYLDGVTVIYAYSPDIFRSEKVGGVRINVMVAVREGMVSLGSPLLVGSY